MTALTVAHRGSMPAYRWDGSEADMHGLVSWLLEHGLRPDRCHYVRQHGVRFFRAVIELNDAIVLPGEYVIITGPGQVVQVDEDQFGEMYQEVQEITIKEIR